MGQIVRIDQWVDFLRVNKRRSPLKAPFLKQRELLKYIFQPDANHVKQVDLMCGRGFGKSVLAILICTMLLSLSPNECILFLEPDWKRVRRVFLKKWFQLVPKVLYSWNKGDQCITWNPTGSLLFYGPRNITGSYGAADDSQLGQDTTAVIDDEAALRCSESFYANTLATIREPSNVRLYLTLSTPRVGSYANLVNAPGHKLFRGVSADNPYLPDGYVEQLRQNMSPQQARRELDGELVSLEGALWPTVDLDHVWPRGNLDFIHPAFKRDEPFWLFCDLGSSNAAYLIVQRRTAYFNGRLLFHDPVWVAVADLCPIDDASASRAFQRIKREFGVPAEVVGGGDLLKRSDTTGDTVAYFATQIFGNIPIRAISERDANKQIQYDCASYLVSSSVNLANESYKSRRFTVAKDFISLEPRSRRGIREMFIEDEWPPENERRASDFLPKNPNIRVQHIRDAFLMGAYAVMRPPSWAHTDENTG